MAKISLDILFKRQKRLRYLTILAFLVVCAVFGQMILFQGKKETRASIGDEGTPYVINTKGFIWSDAAGSYFVSGDGSNNCMVRFVGANQNGADASGLIVDTDSNGTNGTLNVDQNCYKNKNFGRTDGDYSKTALNPKGNNITDRHVQVENGAVVAMWGAAHFASFTVAGSAVVTHAPLVYLVGSGSGYDFRNLSVGVDQFDPNNTNPHQNAAAYTPGYVMNANGEQDFDLNTGSISASGEDKKVEIWAHKIRVLDGQINVAGRGYPGANGNNHDGGWLDRTFTDYYTEYAGHVYSSTGTRVNTAIPTGLPLNYGGAGGFWSRCNANVIHTGGGASGFAGRGGDAKTMKTTTTEVCVYSGCTSCTSGSILNGQAATASYGDVANPSSGGLLYGPGGGASGRYDTDVDRGGSGGGTINLVGANSGEIELHSKSVLNASGQNGIDSSGNQYYGGGAGAGGTVFLNGNIKLVDIASNSSVRGGVGNGSTGSLLSWDNSQYTYTEQQSLSLTAVTLAKGGNGETSGSGACTTGTNCGGGGGGGAIVLTGSTVQSCTITPFDSGKIPVACENEDVVIDGYPTADPNWSYVNADAVSVTQPDGTTDTKRHFKSLTIKNRAVLTHQAITATDLNTNTRTSIAATSQKKVDIVVYGPLTLQNYGKIDVAGKGYPGGTFVGDCGYDDKYIPVRGGGIGLGYGTAPGSKFRGNGQGGGFGGVGGNDPTGWGIAYPNPFNALTMTATTFDFGSGGGASYGSVFHGGLAQDHDWSCISGGNGGGRIHVDAASINVDTTSKLSADGGDQTVYRDEGETHGAGGGAGGMIWLESDLINLPSGGIAVDVTGTNNGGKGSLNLINANISFPTNITAKGGNGAGGGGAGGRVILGRVHQPPVSIKKTLVAVNRPFNATPVNANFNPYALQINDKIRVDLNVSGLVPGLPITITDNLLTNGLVKCANPADVSGNGGHQNGNSIEWNITPGVAEEELNYECTIQ